MSWNGSCNVARMYAIDVPKPQRRWSKRSLILTVSGLVMAVLVLVVALVGFARSVDFVLGADKASDALTEVGQIAPDRTATPGTSVTTPIVAADSAPPVETTAPEPVWTPPVQVARASGGGGAAASSVAVGSGGVSAPDDDEAASGSGGLGGSGGNAGTGGLGGSGGASPSGSDVVRSALLLLGQTTSTMCGFNTCNSGQVCCNFSCGVCAAPGSSCDQTQCAGTPRAPTAVRCGAGQCNDGQVCCNPSCGICAAPGEVCSTDVCQ